MYELYEDKNRKDKKEKISNKYSPYCDVIYYSSSRNPELNLCMRVLKPEKPSYILANTHGWHMSMPDFVYADKPFEGVEYLTLQVDMRGRAYSDGQPDCNGWELYDVIDAINFAKEYYKEYILDSEIVYFEGGSGGGGNAYAIVGKFPDFFAAATSLCGISDYAMWYRQDELGEFRDEMDVWIGVRPEENMMAYQSRSGIYLLRNLYTPLFIAHSEKDIRVPVTHSRNYIEKAKKIGKEKLISYFELEGVGTRDHWGNASKEQLEKVKTLSENNRIAHRKPIEIPDKGKMIIGGYLVTKRFSVFLDSIDKSAVLEYDLSKGDFRLTCDVKCDYKIIQECDKLSKTSTV